MVPGTEAVDAFTQDWTDVFRCGIWDRGGLTDPRLLSLADALPDVVVQSRAKTTVKQYKGCFQQFKNWCSHFNGVNHLPAEEFNVSLYLLSLTQLGKSPSCVQALYSIGWAHDIAGFVNPCSSHLVRSVVEASRRMFNKSVVKKEPITPDILSRLVVKFGGPNASLFDVRSVAFCLVAYAGFLRFSEAVNLKCSDVIFSEGYMTLFIEKSKTDIYRDGHHLVISATGSSSCPVSMMKRYFHMVCFKGREFVFRPLSYCRMQQSYHLRGVKPISYTRMREIILDMLESIGLQRSSFGLHSLRSGGATEAANSGVPDRLFKRHGRWKSETAKDAYVKDNLSARLSVTQKLGL